MTTPLRTIAVAALLLGPPCLSAPALAQGTAAQRAACGPDAVRLCASHIPDPGAVASCLRRERASLGDACRATVDAAGAPRADTIRTGRLAGPSTLPRHRIARSPDGRRIVRTVPRGLAGLPFGRHRAEMRQARYWMGQLGAYAPMAMGLIGGSGVDLGAIREMRIGEVVDMMR